MIFSFMVRGGKSYVFIMVVCGGKESFGRFIGARLG